MAKKQTRFEALKSWGNTVTVVGSEKEADAVQAFHEVLTNDDALDSALADIQSVMRMDRIAGLHNLNDTEEAAAWALANQLDETVVGTNKSVVCFVLFYLLSKVVAPAADIINKQTATN